MRLIPLLRGLFIILLKCTAQLIYFFFTLKIWAANNTYSICNSSSLKPSLSVFCIQESQMFRISWSVALLIHTSNYCMGFFSFHSHPFQHTHTHTHTFFLSYLNTVRCKNSPFTCSRLFFEKSCQTVRLRSQLL